MTRKGRRLVLIGSALGVGIAACLLILFALRDSIVFFYSPSEVVAKDVPPGTRVRLGGLVEVGTVNRQAGGLVTFRVTDNTRDLPVRYTGLLPDLFREGQGVVAEGALDSSGTVVADTILAKHDERYMPRDVADKLKKDGLWQGREASGAGTAGTQAASTAAEAVTIR